MVVIEAHNLKKHDVMGKSDPFVEISTLPQCKEKSSVEKKTLTPSWNESLHVLVQVLSPHACAAHDSQRFCSVLPTDMADEQLGGCGHCLPVGVNLGA